MRAVLTLAWLLAASPFATAGDVLAANAVLYVSLAGDNATGDGSINRPYRTIDKAAAMAQAGTSVYVRGGTYPAVNEFIHVTVATSAAPVRIQAHPGEHVVLDGGGPFRREQRAATSSPSTSPAT